mmetsp:Transcript_4366/g.5851  ORF Transcript_4366/g.5851 Transcript_4366/m.5851 type:complete len:243 (-) Transcript_4366:837-1565(-)|eukprot:CAMPEP_0196581222 /NCGR_PEP_ID=MMETSP1081-20130531/32989_1 /TAXON_ID=36882 /ORGANISM="Pyramimonas amylifera, Strain CCMP720" /LENGTH=242 /DNA_ID=CAMNT_0041901363 /DNA_START=266 /DNA_END=994 /DNA_ORIENTATION=-
MNNNQVNEQALLANCKGLFQASSYISFGTDAKPNPYGLKAKARSAFGGKQMLTNPIKEGRMPDIYFDKKFAWVSDGDKFHEQTLYSKIQKERKNGFMSADFRRRDEFSNSTRTEQYREQLKTEMTLAKEQLKRGSKLDTITFYPEDVARQIQTAPTKFRPCLYDLVYESEDNTSASRLAKDTKNPTSLSKARDFGQTKTSSMKYGYNIQKCAHGKPEHARIPIVRSTFYRPSKIPLHYAHGD